MELIKNILSIIMITLFIKFSKLIENLYTMYTKKIIVTKNGKSLRNFNKIVFECVSRFSSD